MDASSTRSRLITSRGREISGKCGSAYGIRRFLVAAIGIGNILLALAACNGLPATPTAFAPTLSPTATATITAPGVTPTATVPAVAGDGSVELTIWAPEDLSPEAAVGGATLRQQIDQFTRDHPNIRVTFAVKSARGKGGLVDFLLKVQSLVPTRLPDLVLIDSRELDTAARAGLLAPLDHDLPAGAMADLLPPAAELARYQGRWLALPVVLDFQHLVYYKDAVRTPPATWDQLLAGSALYAFPANDDDAFLFQYLDNRGRISTDQGTAQLDISVTTSVLTFYQRARASKLVPDSTLAAASSREAWTIFADGQAGMAQVGARDYLAGRSRNLDMGFAPLPTSDGKPATVVSSWNYAIVTTDAGHQTAAAELLSWLDDPVRLAEWANAAQLVPARRSALAASSMPEDYADFLRGLLDSGIAAPTLSQRAPYEAGWRSALQSVLRGQATPSEAALRAAQSLP